jgi:septal ring factor EnvC (AmiA/AmiB activator)
MPTVTAELESLILEQLRHIRSRLDTQADLLREVTARLGSLENQAAQLHKGVAFLHEDIAGVNARLDRLTARVDRIEQRLQLSESA